MSESRRRGGLSRLSALGPAAWFACTITCSAMPDSAAAVEEIGNSYAALTAGYAEGDFGTSVKSELYSLTPEFGYVNDSYDLSASIPLQSLRTSGGGRSSTESGIGDAVLRAGRRLWRDPEGQVSFNGALLIKLATGDEDRGLGTGATDVGVQLSADRKVGAYSFIALAGYTQVGEPTGVSYDNVVSYGIGVNRSFVRTNVFASLQGQTSAVPGATSPLQVDLGFFRILSADYVVIAHAFLGLSDGSPDGGVGLGIVRWF